ncbi:MAG: E3 binding domain-containing protein, partial [Gemmatimonadota bacterium]
MATKVLMEALSPTMEEGRLVEWKKAEGDPVAAGDVLAEVETDKAVMELVARGSGVLLKQSIPAGTTVPVTSTIGWIGEPGEAIPTDGAAPPAKAPARSLAPAASAPPAAAAAASIAPQSAGRIKASPLARRMAREQGLDLAVVSGSGPEGRIVKRDVEAARTPGAAIPSHAFAGTG